MESLFRGWLAEEESVAPSRISVALVRSDYQVLYCNDQLYVRQAGSDISGSPFVVRDLSCITFSTPTVLCGFHDGELFTLDLKESSDKFGMVEKQGRCANRVSKIRPFPKSKEHVIFLEGGDLYYAEANDFGLLEQTFIEYGQSGKGKSRKYLHTYDEAVPWNQVPGTFTPWQPLPEPTDVLFYEGLHGGVVTPQHNVAQHVDLLVGVVPIVNLEWIQKLIRDTSERGHSREAVMDSVVRSMEDYINYITPQFSRTHLNFQRVPTVDTSNPFAAKGIPSLDESFVVIHFRNLEGIDFPWLLAMLQGSFISHINTLVVPGGKMGLAMELIMLPLVQRLMEGKKIE